MSKGIRSLRDIKPGDIYTIDGKDVWEVTHHCSEPTISLRNLRTGQEMGGAVGSPIMAEFVKLLPQIDATE